MDTLIIPGSEITDEDLKIINEQRVIKFDAKEIWDHSTNKDFHNWLFVLVKENQELKAFGDMEDVELHFDNLTLPILGVGGIASIEEGKGYGKLLMQAMVSYAKENEETLVGFCDPQNRGFYLKCGLKIKEDGNLNFIHKKEDGTEITDSGDVLYYSENDNEVTKAIESNKKIFHLIPHW